MNNTAKAKLNTDITTGRPSSFVGGGFVLLLIRAIVSAVSSYSICMLIFKGFDIGCDSLLILKTTVLTTLVFSLLSINVIPLAIGLAFVAYKLYNYIKENSDFIKEAFKVIANGSYEVIRISLDLPYADGFDDVISDTYTAINTVSIIIALIVSIVMVIVVVKLCSKLIYAVGMAFVFSLLSFFRCDIDHTQALLILICFSLTIVLGAGSTKLPSLPKLIKKSKKTFIFNGNIIYTLQYSFISLITLILIISGINSVFSYDDFSANFTDKYSENIRVTTRDIALMKYAEYKKNSLPANISMGQLGYMSYVKPDANVNVFTFVSEPITEGKIYFKLFTGQNYNYRYNSWSEIQDYDTVMANALKSAGAQSRTYELRNSAHYMISPQYSDIKDKTYNDKNRMEVTAYDYTPVEITDTAYTQYVNGTYLTIDEENKEVIDKICSEQGFTKEDPDLTSKLADYFNNNFTYTFEGISIPYGKDYVNYFLQESRTGNYAQYASALTLIYRNLGIPARYAGGYAVEAAQTLENYKPGRKTSTTQVKRTNMYSWVEIYDPSTGWQIIDIAPSPTLEELNELYGKESENTYTPDTSLENYFRTVDKEKYTPSNIAKNGLALLFKIAVFAIAALSAIILIVFVLRFTYKYILYLRADNSKKAYIIMERLKKKYKAENISYKELGNIISKDYGYKKANEIIELSEKCMFSSSPEDKDIAALIKLIYHK